MLYLNQSVSIERTLASRCRPRASAICSSVPCLGLAEIASGVEKSGNGPASSHPLGSWWAAGASWAAWHNRRQSHPVEVLVDLPYYVGLLVSVLTSWQSSQPQTSDGVSRSAQDKLVVLQDKYLRLIEIRDAAIIVIVIAELTNQSTVV